MERAFQLAQIGKYSTSPNPRVGAVIVYKERIIGEGYHQQYGGAHAEVNAVQSVSDKSLLSQSTIYVTLEPCAHFGKTPPCVDLLIQHRFKRVVIANTDPFKKVNGSGVQKLKTAGIEVITGILEQKGLGINRRFFMFHTANRPYIVLKWAETQDGFMYKNEQSENWITNSVSKQLVHVWRAEEDAILVGKNTVITDNPELTVREAKGKNPLRIVIDRKNELAKNLKIFNAESKTVVLNELLSKEEANIELVKVNFNESLPSLVNRVCVQRNLPSVIIEGGAQILQQFIAEGMWDEARIFTADKSFIEGITAPRIKGKLIAKEVIKSDTLRILKNEKI